MNIFCIFRWAFGSRWLLYKQEEFHGALGFLVTWFRPKGGIFRGTVDPSWFTQMPGAFDPLGKCSIIEL